MQDPCQPVGMFLATTAKTVPGRDETEWHGYCRGVQEACQASVSIMIHHGVGGPP